MTNDEKLIAIPTINGIMSISVSEHPNQMYGDLSALKVLANYSLSFYVGLNKAFGKNWHPLSSDTMYRKLELNIFKASDNETIQSLGEEIVEKTRELKAINKILMDWISAFWNYKSANEVENYAKSGRKRFRIRNGEPLPWENNLEFRSKLKALESLVESIGPLEVKLLDELYQVYGYSQISNMGSQRAKDLIDKSYASSHKQAIKYLTKAASLDENSFMAYKAFNSLGDIYLAKGDFELAAENYSKAIKSIESVIRNPQIWTKRLSLLRGLSYFKSGKIQEGLGDIKLGISDVENPEKYFEVYESEYREALGLLGKYS